MRLSSEITTGASFGTWYFFADDDRYLFNGTGGSPALNLLEFNGFMVQVEQLQKCRVSANWTGITGTAFLTGLSILEISGNNRH